MLLDNTTIFFSNVYQDTISCYTLITNKSAKVEYLVAISLPLADHTPQCCCNVLRMCENNFFLKYYNLKMPSFSFYKLKMINLQCCQLNYIIASNCLTYIPDYWITLSHLQHSELKETLLSNVMLVKHVTITRIVYRKYVCIQSVYIEWVKHNFSSTQDDI